MCEFDVTRELFNSEADKTFDFKELHPKEEKMQV
jgi:hypothetical protein